MLKATKQQAGNTLVVKLSGTIDETDDLGALLGMPAGALTVNCAEVSRINSIGVKAWIKYFQALQTKKIPVKLEELSSPLVEQINVIQNFGCGAEIVSVTAPFLCGKCQTRMSVSLKTADLKNATFPLAPVKCVKCGADAAFDDFEDEYFAYVKR